MIAAVVASAHLPGVLHDLEPTLDQYGYVAVAGLIAVEDFGVPVPGETILILAAIYAGTGGIAVAIIVRHVLRARRIRASSTR